ncbi:MAG TPA: chemotaxis response regulator protein-glutamate methylesterase [Terracidiphilus sp.]|jgi:two-component system chemotaxis response regulator CheB
MGPERRTRILIVDDSAVMRSLLRSVVCADAGIEVAGTASDGESALQAMEKLRPDLVLMDVEMPVMDGLVTLRKMRERSQRVPVIMCSSLTQRGARVTIEALAGGAADYVAKPSGDNGREAALKALAQDLIPKIKALTAGVLRTPAVFPGANRAVLPMPTSMAGVPTPTVVAIGVSTGGPAALDRVLPGLPSTFPLPVLVVQHMPELFTRLLAERLNGRCGLRVREGEEGEPVRPGSILIARGNWHMEVLASARPGAEATLHLTQAPAENHCRPAVDVMLRTAAAVYGAGVLSVILTGMGSDGLAGCRNLRRLGAGVLVQDQATSAVWGMPGAVATAGLAHRVLPLEGIAPEIVRLCGRRQSEGREARETGL